jgi:hypothetical protein
MASFRSFVIGLSAGCILMFTVPSFAETVKQYILVKPAYPIYVNGLVYESSDLPVLNYEGNTYVPMKAVGELLGASVTWNNELKRAEIRYGTEVSEANAAFAI